MSAATPWNCPRVARWIGIGVVAATVACGGGQVAPASTGAPSATVDPAVAAYRAVVKSDQSDLQSAYRDVRKWCTRFEFQITPDLAHCLPTMTGLATSVRKMKAGLGTASVPKAETAANAALIGHLTDLAAAIDSSIAQLEALGDGYATADWGFFTDNGANPQLQLEEADVTAITR